MNEDSREQYRALGTLLFNHNSYFKLGVRDIFPFVRTQSVKKKYFSLRVLNKGVLSIMSQFLEITRQIVHQSYISRRRNQLKKVFFLESLK